jgi:hypothetical protein
VCVVKYLFKPNSQLCAHPISVLRRSHSSRLESTQNLDGTARVNDDDYNLSRVYEAVLSYFQRSAFRVPFELAGERAQEPYDVLI